MAKDQLVQRAREYQESMPMVTWSVVTGDILDQSADVLVCSANPFLTLSGGVGGAFQLRYGSDMQDLLRSHLDAAGARYVPPGTVLSMPPCGSPYKVVMHAVAVDAFYDSSAELIAKIVVEVLALSYGIGAEVVALPALATGYGHLTMREFAEGLRQCRGVADVPLGVVVCVMREEDAALIRAALEIE